MEPSGPYARSARSAWTAVGVLWLMAFLYYCDRLLLTSMRDAIRANIGIDDAQFGLLTSSFLWIYGLLGPLGGFVSDKFGRRRVILASLATWTLAVWLTSQAHNFGQLLGTRVLMGISEACFLPASLALINNHHRGPTRSLATGVFNTGLYLGSACGGIGGWLADHYGWRVGFLGLAVAGIGCVAAAAVLLTDTGAGEERTPQQGEVTLRQAMAALLGDVAFWAMVGVFCIVSLANWLVYGWLATYLHEQFHLTHGVAGLSATGYIPVGAFAGVLLGGVLSDRWSRTHRRARAWVAAIGIALAAPALYVAGSTAVFSAAVVGLVIFGIGRGFLDANSMPILRLLCSEKYSATGYGFLNATGCIVGGLTTYLGGVLLDAHISLGIVFRLGAGAMLVIAIVLASVRPRAR